MKRKAFAFWEVVVVLAIIVILAAILYPVLAPRPPHGSYRSACKSNLKQISLSIAQYNDDYDDRFPPAQNATGGWVELIFPYVKSDQIFHCPSDKTDSANKTTDYFINMRLTGLEANSLDFQSLTILMGDGMRNSAPFYHLSQLPDAWRRDQKSPANRHLDGANYSFADGHIKWYKPDGITLAKPAVKKPTFLLR